MTKIGVSADLNCSANHVDDSFGQFYGDTACGTLIVVNGTLFGPASIPAGSSASPRTAFTSVSQSLTTGSGTTADPYTIVTVVDAGSTGVRLTQTDSYVVGQESWRTDVEIANTTATDAFVRLYRAFDCYRADSDFGYGYGDLASGTVACQSQQSDPTPLLQIAPITPGSRFYEAFYDQIWAKIGAQEAFPDTCRCEEYIDNGAGLSWDVSVPAGATEVRSERITITQGTPVGGAITPEETLGSGNASELPVHCNRTGYPVNCATGNFWHTFADVAVPGRGPALALGRTYNSLDAGRDGPFGFGWASSYTMRLVPDSVAGTVTIHQENGAQVKFTDDGTGTYTAPPRMLGRLVRHADGTFTFTRKKRQHFEFAADGRLTSIRDLNGYTTTLAYDASARLATITDAAGRALNFNHGPDGRIASVTDPAGRTVSYGYNAAGELVNVTDVAGGVTSFTYGLGHLLETMTDPRGGVVTNTYDTSRRVTAQQDPTGGVTSFEYTSSGTNITDPNGNIETQTYVSGQLRSLTRGVGTANPATWTYTYDQSTLGRTSVEDPNGRTTTMTYDVDGNRTSTIDPLGRQTTASFNAFNSPEAVTDPAGITADLLYDANGNLLSVSRPLAGTADTQTTTFTYGDTAHPGDVTAITDPTNRTWQLAYDADGNLTVVTDPAGAATTHSYNGIGWRTATVSPRGNVTGADPAAYTTSYAYNDFGDLLTVTDPTGAVTTYAYDANRNVTSVTDPDGNVTGYAYDAADRPTTVTRADGTTVSSGYDAKGNLTSQTDAAGNVTSYTYDPLDRVSSSTDPLTRTTIFGYDPAGNQTSIIDAAGQTTTLSYDVASQLTGVTYSDGITAAVSYGYDAKGRRTSMTDGTGTSTYIWDSLDRLSSTTDGAGKTVGYGYDLSGRITAITYPNAQTVARSYDTVGRLGSVTDWLANTTTFSYDLDGNLIGEARPNNTTATYTVHAASRVMGIDHTGPGGVIAAFDYTRKASGLLASATTTGITAPAESYGYTPLDQLASVNTDTYDYDAADNITKLLDGTTMVHDAASQLTSLTRPDATTASFGYDSRGNRTSGVGIDGAPAGYVYDQANRLVGVESTVPVPDSTTRVSVASSGTQADAASARPDMSADGRYVAFDSDATNLVPGDTNLERDVFVHDRSSGETTRVSVDSAGNQGDRASMYPAISADGRFVVFESWSANLVTGDTNAKPDVFIHDRNTGSTTRVSVTSNGAEANGPSGSGADVSADGSVVVFKSDATNLVNGDTNASADVFAHDRATGTTTMVSVAGDGTQGDAGSDDVSISGNGQFVTFMSTATNLVTADTNAVRDVFVHDRTTGTTQRVSQSSAGAQADDASDDPVISHDGRYVAFDTLATNLVTGDTNGRQDIMVHDRATGTTERISVSSDGTQGDLNSDEPSISADGLHVAFYSLARNLIADDTNAAGDVFVHHRDTGKVERVSISSTGAQGDGASREPHLVMSANGQHTAFRSGATNLVPDDTNAVPDIFVRQTGATTTTTTATYTYNGDGLRTAKTVNNTTTTFTWHHANGLPLVLTDGTNNYIYGPAGLPLTQIGTDGTTTWFHQDQIGSTRALTDNSGATVATYTYDAYGNQTEHTGTATTPLGYAGEFRDSETRFSYLRARYYDPATSQFLTRDPVVATTMEPYAYVGNNPTNFTDPTGLCWGPTCLVEDAVDAVGGAVDFLDDHKETIAAGASILSYTPLAPIAGPTAVLFGGWSAYGNLREGDLVGAALDTGGTLSGLNVLRLTRNISRAERIARGARLSTHADWGARELAYRLPQLRQYQRLSRTFMVTSLSLGAWANRDRLSGAPLAYGQQAYC